MDRYEAVIKALDATDKLLSCTLLNRDEREMLLMQRETIVNALEGDEDDEEEVDGGTDGDGD